MSNEQVNAIIAYIPLFLSITAATVILLGWGKSWQKAASEKSVGATKVKELEKTATEVHNDIAELKRNSETCQREISKLQDDYRRLIDHVWDLLGKK